MRKAFSIALILLTATIAVPAASADPPLGEQIIAQEKAKNVAPKPASQTAVDRIVAQERARAGDPALLGPSSTPVLVVGPSDEFDLRDAGIGGAMALALALLVAAGVAVRNGRRTPETASAQS